MQPIPKDNDRNDLFIGNEQPDFVVSMDEWWSDDPIITAIARIMDEANRLRGTNSK